VLPPLRFGTVRELVHAIRPRFPVFCVRPQVIAAAVRRFAAAFPGRVLYAVECNSHPLVLRALHEAGVRHFDAASLREIACIHRSFADSTAYFMHPVKDREAIRIAYRAYEVREFAVDSAAELEKLLAETGGEDLRVFVRIATARADLRYHLSASFGAEPAEAAELLQTLARRGCRTGLTFEVGSQCLEPKAYRSAFERLGLAIEASGVEPSAIDVGGGFPQAHPDLDVPRLEDYVAEIRAGLRSLRLRVPPELIAEPAGALVASACSVLTQVKLRKDDRLYLNDGVHGSLSQQLDSEAVLPTRFHPARARIPAEPAAFSIHGPTCDPLDVLASRLRAPADAAEGDWLEIGEVGAYSCALATRFNGFGLDAFAEVHDAPPPWSAAGLAPVADWS
jgi:ornithine decarboxylase